LAVKRRSKLYESEEVSIAKNYNDADLVYWIHFDHHCDDEKGFVTALERRRTSPAADHLSNLYRDRYGKKIMKNHVCPSTGQRAMRDLTSSAPCSIKSKHD
jgi:hypothetical protein